MMGVLIRLRHLDAHLLVCERMTTRKSFRCAAVGERSGGSSEWLSLSYFSHHVDSQSGSITSFCQTVATLMWEVRKDRNLYFLYHLFFLLASLFKDLMGQQKKKRLKRKSIHWTFPQQFVILCAVASSEW